MVTLAVPSTTARGPDLWLLLCKLSAAPGFMQTSFTWKPFPIAKLSNQPQGRWSFEKFKPQKFRFSLRCQLPSLDPVIGPCVPREQHPTLLSPWYYQNLSKQVTDCLPQSLIKNSYIQLHEQIWRSHSQNYSDCSLTKLHPSLLSQTTLKHSGQQLSFQLSP